MSLSEKKKILIKNTHTFFFFSSPLPSSSSGSALKIDGDASDTLPFFLFASASEWVKNRRGRFGRVQTRFLFLFASASEWVKNRRAGPDVFPVSVSVSVFASASEWAKNIEKYRNVSADAKKGSSRCLSVDPLYQ